MSDTGEPRFFEWPDSRSGWPLSAHAMYMVRCGEEPRAWASWVRVVPEDAALEALAERDTAEAQAQRYKEALERIANFGPTWAESAPRRAVGHLREIARAALSQPPESEGECDGNLGEGLREAVVGWAEENAGEIGQAAYDALMAITERK